MFQPATSASAAINARRDVARTQARAGGRGSGATATGGRPRARPTRARARPSPRGRSCAVVRVADRAREQLGPSRRDDDAATDLARRAARSRSRRPPRRSPAARRRGPVEAARDDVARRGPRASPTTCTSAADSDCGEHLARLVVEEAHAGRPRAARRARRARRGARRVPMIDDPQVVEIAKERRRANQRVEILRVADVAGVHDDEACRRARARATTRCRCGCGRESRRVDPVRDHDDPLRRRALRPRAARASSRRSRRCGRHGAGRARRAPRSSADERRGFSSRFSSTAISGKTSWLIDDERHAEAGARRASARSPIDRRVGHAEDDVGPRRARGRAQSALAEIRHVVERARAKSLRAVEGRSTARGGSRRRSARSRRGSSSCRAARRSRP